MLEHTFEDLEQLQKSLLNSGYVADKALATALYLTLALERPLLLEGEPGVGKTEVAKVLAKVLGRPMLRLQCYEGLDRQSSLYEWNYQKQLLHIRVSESTSTDEREKSIENEIFKPEYLLKRPLLEAIWPPGETPVLLIDEVDRSDEEFEAFLLELLAEFQITIPELGTIQAKERPVVILTSNRTREIHDALKRRCTYQWIDYPDFEKELRILSNKLSALPQELLSDIVRFVQKLRMEPLFKRPGIAETLHWGEALYHLSIKRLDHEIVEQTLGCLLKYKEDFELLESGTPATRLQKLVHDVQESADEMQR